MTKCHCLYLHHRLVSETIIYSLQINKTIQTRENCNSDVCKVWTKLSKKTEQSQNVVEENDVSLVACRGNNQHNRWF